MIFVGGGREKKKTFLALSNKLTKKIGVTNAQITWNHEKTHVYKQGFFFFFTSSNISSIFFKKLHLYIF